MGWASEVNRSPQRQKSRYTQQVGCSCGCVWGINQRLVNGWESSLDGSEDEDEDGGKKWWFVEEEGAGADGLNALAHFLFFFSTLSALGFLGG